MLSFQGGWSGGCGEKNVSTEAVSAEASRPGRYCVRKSAGEAPQAVSYFRNLRVFFFFLPRVVMSGGGGERLLICALETVKHRRLGANLRNEVCCLERARSALNSLTPLMGIPLPFLSTL